MPLDRRQFTLGALSTVCGCLNSRAQAATSLGGCVFHQAAGSTEYGIDADGNFPGLRRGNANQSEIAMGPLIVDMFQLFQVTPIVGFFDDSDTCRGDARSINKALFPELPNMPFKVDGTIAIGTKLWGALESAAYQTAMIGAVCSHEFGHIIQFKYVNEPITKIILAEGSVVRAELFADFVCGYHAGIKHLNQNEYPAVMAALNQFQAGDRRFGLRHHGTPEERGVATQEGISLGGRGAIAPERLASLALEYVRGLKLTQVESEKFCG